MTQEQVIEYNLRLWAEIAPDECIITDGGGFYGPDTFYLSSVEATLYNRMEFVGSPYNRDKFPMYIQGAVERAIEKRGWEWSKAAGGSLPYCVEAYGENGRAGTWDSIYGNTLFEAFIGSIDNERKRESGCTPA